MVGLVGGGGEFGGVVIRLVGEFGGWTGWWRRCDPTGWRRRSVDWTGWWRSGGVVLIGLRMIGLRR